MEREQGKRETKTESGKERDQNSRNGKSEGQGRVSFSPVSPAGFPQGVGPPCFSLVSIATGRAAPNLHIHLHPFFLHNSTGSVHIHETVSEGDSPSPCSKPGSGAPCMQYVAKAPDRPTPDRLDLSLPDPANYIPPYSPSNALHSPTSTPFLRCCPSACLGCPSLSMSIANGTRACMHSLTCAHMCVHMNSGAGSDQCSPWLLVEEAPKSHVYLGASDKEGSA